MDRVTPASPHPYSRQRLPAAPQWGLPAIVGRVPPIMQPGPHSVPLHGSTSRHYPINDLWGSDMDQAYSPIFPILDWVHSTTLPYSLEIKRKPFCENPLSRLQVEIGEICLRYVWCISSLEGFKCYPFAHWYIIGNTLFYMALGAIIK